MTDLLLRETGTGGDLLLRGKDLVQVQGYENTLYLAMFGGDQYWGNYLNPAKPYNCQTERALRENVLNSSGRLAIENAIKTDLAFLGEIPGTTYTVSVVLAGKDRVDINIEVNGQTFYYSFNPDTLYLTYRVG